MFIIISIVVPCFNAEKTIGECLKSILGQTYKNIEVLVIDDGSTDRTEQEVKKMKLLDQRIKYYYQENQGVSQARNLGIQNIKGDYLAFVDSDDYVDRRYLEILLKNMLENDCELSVCNWSRNYDKFNSTKEFRNKKVSREEFIEDILTENNVKGYLWNKLFKSEIVKNNSLILDLEIHFMEDLLFCVKYSMSIKKEIVITDQILYYYLEEGESITNNGYSLKKETGVTALESIFLSVCQGYSENLELQNMYYTYYLHFTVSILVRGVYENKLSPKSKIELLKKIKNSDLKKINSRDVKISLILIKINFSLYYTIWKIIKKES